MHFTNCNNDNSMHSIMKKIWTKIVLDVDSRDYNTVEQDIALWPDICGIMETEPKPSITRLEIYSTQTNVDKIQTFVDYLKKFSKQVTFELISYDPADETEWKKYFKPQKIGKHFVIRPSWEKYEAKAEDLVIVIDPGSAFGTGLHETTRGVLILLEDIAKKAGKNFLGSEVLDAGTGSGVLSVGAILLGAKKVKAIDNDPEAVMVAQDNFKINKVSSKAKAYCLGLEQEQKKYDVVLANIISEVLIENKNKVIELLKDKANLILSGIITTDESKVIDAYNTNTKLKLKKVLHLGEWSSIWFSN